AAAEIPEPPSASKSLPPPASSSSPPPFWKEPSSMEMPLLPSRRRRMVGLEVENTVVEVEHPKTAAVGGPATYPETESTTTVGSGTITSAQPWPLNPAPPLLVLSEVIRIDKQPLNSPKRCCCRRNPPLVRNGRLPYNTLPHCRFVPSSLHVAIEAAALFCRSFANAAAEMWLLRLLSRFHILYKP
ncbi:hypothetical protein PIB30_077470, partial [Stylosanthes scabra]|nr:hypothetical protein [Stylosanthes scabra]